MNEELKKIIHQATNFSIERAEKNDLYKLNTLGYIKIIDEWPRLEELFVPVHRSKLEKIAALFRIIENYNEQVTHEK